MRTPLRLAACAGIAAALTAVPVGYSPAAGFQVTKACADGTCCKELDDICGLNGQNYSDKYWTQSGPCPKEVVIDDGAN